MIAELAPIAVFVLFTFASLAGVAAMEAGFWSTLRNQPRDVFGRTSESSPDLAWVRENPLRVLAALLSLRATLVVAVGFASAAALGSAGLETWVAGGALLSLGLAILHLIAQSTVASRSYETHEALARVGGWTAYLMAPAAIPLSALARFLLGGRALVAPDDETWAPTGWTDETSTAEKREDHEDRQMVQGVLDLQETLVREVMVPRVDVAAVEVDTPFDDVVQLIVARGLSRIPLYEETLDTVIGVIYAKDLLPALSNAGEAPDLRSLARPAFFVPETKRLGDLLREFRSSRVHIAIVVDEYGGTAGLVTFEDLLEEIVGDIRDEYDLQSQAELERISEHEALVDARMSIFDFNELFDLQLESEHYDTIGGFVYTQLGRIPSAGDEVRVDGLVVSVVSTVGRRIKRVRVDRLPVGGSSSIGPTPVP